MRVAVLGGGHGAHAHAGHLSLAGHEVCLCHLSERAASIEAARVRQSIGVETAPGVEGVPTGVAQLACVTTDFHKAISGADVILLVVAAQGQELFLSRLLPYVQDGQILLICPGKFGALVARRGLKDMAAGSNIIVAESESLLYIARLEGVASVRISGIKKRLRVATLPAREGPQAIQRLRELHPQFALATHVLETSFSDPGNVMHPVHTLLNLGRIEELGSYRYDHYGVTASMGRVIDALDRERLEVAEALGMDIQSVPQLLHSVYGSSPESAADAIRTTSGYRGFTSPGDLNHRFITENVPYGLVPIASIGRQIGVQTPAMDAVIEIAEAAAGHPFRQQGRGLAQMGLAGRDAAGILEAVG